MRKQLLIFLFFIVLLVGCNDATLKSNTDTTSKIKETSLSKTTVSLEKDTKLYLDSDTLNLVKGATTTINLTYDRTLGLFPQVTVDNTDIISIKAATTRITVNALTEGDATIKIVFGGVDYFIKVKVGFDLSKCEYSLKNFDSFDINCAVNQQIDLSYNLIIGEKEIEGASLEFINNDTNEALLSPLFTSSERGTYTFTIKPKYGDIDYKNYYKSLTINVYNTYDSLTEKSYKYIGRYNQKLNKYRFDNVNSGIEISFMGSTLDAVVKNESQVRGRVKVIIDGSYTKYINLENYAEEKHISVEGLSNSIHFARIINVFEESFTFSLDLSTIKADAYSELKKRDYTMLVLGDSITCGYGVYGDDPKYEYADSSLAYSYLIAERLNADYEMLSSRGIGVMYGHRGEQNMITLYNRASIPDFGKAYENTSHDIVIINLGTNDGAKLDLYNQDEKGFKGYYYDLLKDVKEDNPNALIFCIYGMMGIGPDLTNGINYAVDRINSEYQTGKCYSFFNFSIAQIGHPVIAEHIIYAEKLYNFMIEKLENR